MPVEFPEVLLQLPLDRIIPKPYQPRRRFNETALRELAAPYELIIHNVLINPEEAVKAGIIATPTLVKVEPEPTKSVFGNLSDPQRILRGLGLEFAQSKKRKKRRCERLNRDDINGTSTKCRSIPD